MQQPNYILQYATESHARDLAKVMRRADADEVYAAAGVSPMDALMHSLHTSPESFAAVDAQGTFAMWGVGRESETSRVGSPWLLGSDRLVTEHRRDLIWTTQRVVNRMRASYDLLENWVDARNDASIEWLCRCGFVIYPSQSFGFLGLPFHRFTMQGGK